ncbi:DNA polymerase III subunit delta' [Streptococcus hyovaginalis]|uniref:DNA polymerase III subunit delta' n=1 Tax=Streptococcus hyovaginalis TaxID=149015 RepID=UPI003AE793C6
MSKNPLTSLLEWQQPLLFKAIHSILVEERRSHAYLFTGGFASWEMALWMTQFQFCEVTDSPTPCGHCRSCRLVADCDFADLAILEPSNGTIKTDDVRSLLHRFSSTSFEGKDQVVIIKEADKMHPNAANSLLKVMEEPQSHIYLILLVNDDNHLLPTIKSRCQLFHFKKNETILVEALEKRGLLKNQASLLASYSVSLQQAETLADDQKVLQLISVLETYSQLALTNKERAYLEVSRLANLAKEKELQDMSFQLLIALFGKALEQEKALALLDAIDLARDMWQHNVSFQNALEYMIINS